MSLLLSIDPGRFKCGLAVVGSDDKPLLSRVVPRDEMAAAVTEAIRRYDPQEVLVGDGTGSRDVVAELKRCCAKPIVLVNETGSTLEARGLYFAENPPRGLRRLVPLGFLLPPRDYDDYVARILVRRHRGHGLPAR